MKRIWKYVSILLSVLVVFIIASTVYLKLSYKKPAMLSKGEVAAVEATPTPTPLPTPTPEQVTPPPSPLIDCIGPDGKHAQASQADCDNLNAFWKAHPPAPPAATSTSGSSSGNSGSTNDSSTATSTSVSADQTTPTPTPTPENAPIVVNTTSVNVTLSKSSANQGDLVYGSGFTITSYGATGWELQNIISKPGVGFYDYSGGINVGASANVRTYVNPLGNIADGTYTGTSIVQYNIQGGGWQNGPTVSYSITVTD